MTNVLLSGGNKEILGALLVAMFPFGTIVTQVHRRKKYPKTQPLSQSKMVNGGHLDRAGWPPAL